MLRISILIFSMLLGVFSALAGEQSSALNTVRMAGITTYKPGGPSHVGGGAHAFGPVTAARGWPKLTGLLNLSDSRGAGGFALTTTSPGYSMGLSLNSSYTGLFATAVGNKFSYTPRSNLGVGATTTYAARFRVDARSNYDGTTIGAITCAGCTGNGTMVGQTTYGFPGSATAGSATAPGTYTVAFTSPTSYSVTSPTNGVIGSGTIAATAGAVSNYPSSGSSAEANFKITQGSTVFATGDTFAIVTYGPQNPAGRATLDSADLKYNIGSDGQYTAVGAPENAVFYIDETNDPGYAFFTSPNCATGPIWTTITNVAPCATIQSIAYALTTLTNAGKVVFLSNGTPRGRAFVQNQKLTVAGNAVTANPTAAITVAGTFLLDGADLTQNGVASPVPGVIGSDGSIFTKVASAPAVGQYSVNNATGVYTFNSADTVASNGASVYLTYAATAYGTTGAYRGCVHLWLSSSAANFTCNGTTFNVPGGLAISPLIVSVNTWDALIDTSISNYTGFSDDCSVSACANNMGVLFDALHPALYGVELVAFGPFKSAFSSVYGSSPNLARSPTVNNFLAAKGTNSQTTFTGTLPTSMRGGNNAGNSIPALAVVAGAVVGVDNGSGTVTGTGVSGTVNHTTGAYSVTFTTAPTSTTYVIFAADNVNANGVASTASGSAASNSGFNLLANPLLDPADTAAQTAACTGTTGLSYLPAPWTCTASNYAGLTLALSNTTSPVGYPQITVTISGVATAAGALTFTNSANIASAHLNPSNPDVVNSSVVSSILPNGGHLYGLLGTQAYGNIASSANFTRPGAYTSGVPTIYTNQTSKSEVSSGNVAYSDLDLRVPGNTSGIFREIMTPPISTQGMTVNAATYQFAISWNAGPVSAVVNFSQAAMRIQ